MLDALKKQRDYIGAMQAVDKIAVKAGKKPEDIALQVVKENIPTINRYIIEHGEVPEKDPILLAAQATVIHENKIWEKINYGGIPDYEQAEKEVLAEEQEMEDKGQVSNFLGSVLGVVFKAGGKALPKINEKRIKAGKKPLLAGKKGKALYNKINKHVQIEAVEDENRNTGKPLKKFSKTDVGIFAGSVMDEVESRKTKDAIMKYLPFAVIGVVLIIYLTNKK